MKDYLPAILFIVGIALMGADAPDHAAYTVAQAAVNLAGLAMFLVSMRMAHKTRTETKIKIEGEN